MTAQAGNTADILQPPLIFALGNKGKENAMSTKRYTIYKLKDSRGPDGYMYHADGPAIREAIAAGKITENDTWDPTEAGLVAKLQAKGV